MIISYIIAGVLGLACLALACAVFFIVRKDYLRKKEQALNARTLFEQGKQAAESREKRTIKVPYAQALREAGIDEDPFNWGIRVLGIACLVGAFLGLLSHKFEVAIVAVACIFGGATIMVNIKRKQRLALFERQFAELLPQLAASVKGSLTLERAVRIAANHTEEPLRSGLLGVLADTSYGISLADAFETLAKRSGSTDVGTLAAAIRIQQRFGGPIIPVIETVGQHADARLKAQQELKTELAGTRLAKWFVAASMPAIFLMMYTTNGDFAQFYQEEPLGWAVLIGAFLIEIAGLFACNRITSCKELEG